MLLPAASVWLRSTPQLRELDLRFNPVQYHKAYSVALSAVSSLAKLDGVSVQQQDPNTDSCLTLGGLRDTPSLWHSSTGEDAGSSVCSASVDLNKDSIHTQPVFQHLDSRIRTWCSTCLQSAASMILLGGLQPYTKPRPCACPAGPISTPHTLGADDWRTQLHSVVLEGRGFRSLAGLAVAHKLVAANLADNLISDLAGLSGCTGLQQLNISNNLVAEVRNSV